VKGVVAIRDSCVESLQRLARLQDQGRLSHEARSAIRQLEETLHRAVALAEELSQYEAGREFHAE